MKFAFQDIQFFSHQWVRKYYTKMKIYEESLVNHNSLLVRHRSQDHFKTFKMLPSRSARKLNMLSNNSLTFFLFVLIKVLKSSIKRRIHDVKSFNKITLKLDLLNQKKQRSKKQGFAKILLFSQNTTQKKLNRHLFIKTLDFSIKKIIKRKKRDGVKLIYQYQLKRQYIKGILKIFNFKKLFARILLKPAISKVKFKSLEYYRNKSIKKNIIFTFHRLQLQAKNLFFQTLINYTLYASHQRVVNKKHQLSELITKKSQKINQAIYEQKERLLQTKIKVDFSVDENNKISRNSKLRIFDINLGINKTGKQFKKQYFELKSSYLIKKKIYERLFFEKKKRNSRKKMSSSTTNKVCSLYITLKQQKQIPEYTMKGSQKFSKQDAFIIMENNKLRCQIALFQNRVEVFDQSYKSLCQENKVIKQILAKQFQSILESSIHSS